MHPVRPILLEDIRAAQKRIKKLALRTPLVRLDTDETTSNIYLKLENLQPVGSFKVRGAGNALALVAEDRLCDGVYTASAGNMAQGLAFVARRRGLRCRVIVPDNAPQTKLTAIRRLGAEIIEVPYDTWWKVLMEHEYEGMEGKFIHPVSDADVIAGNGTIGLEIVEDLPDVDAVLVPYGGGGLSCGIASAVKSLNPKTRVFACEVDTAAPLSASLKAGSPQTIEHTPSFVDGIGGKSVLPEMWPLVSRLLDDSLVVTLEQVAAAVRLLVERNRIVSEGAGAASVAAALSGKVDAHTPPFAAAKVARSRSIGDGAPIAENIVCVISGGNLDASKLVQILQGSIPQPG